MTFMARSCQSKSGAENEAFIDVPASRRHDSMISNITMSGEFNSGYLEQLLNDFEDGEKEDKGSKNDSCPTRPIRKESVMKNKLPSLPKRRQTLAIQKEEGNEDDEKERGKKCERAGNSENQEQVFEGGRKSTGKLKRFAGVAAAVLTRSIDGKPRKPQRHGSQTKQPPKELRLSWWGSKTRMHLQQRGESGDNDRQSLKRLQRRRPVS